jgi:hypothetical protein
VAAARHMDGLLIRQQMHLLQQDTLNLTKHQADELKRNNLSINGRTTIPL